MTREEACRLLADAPVFWSRLGFCYDPPRAGADGKPIVFCEDFAKYRRCHYAFSAIGVNVHSSIIHSGWMGVDRYDYSLTDRTLDALLSEKKYATIRDILSTMNPADIAQTAG